MSMNALPSVEALRQLLTYDPETGKLFWRARTPEMFSAGNSSSAIRARNWNKRYANKEAFTATNRQGYKTGAIFNRLYKAHRIAWALHYGEDPIIMVDHINGNRIDNRIVNLRLATNQQNQWNSKPYVGCSSPLKGVCWDKSRGLWMAKINLNGKTKNLGRFETEIAAKRAYDEASSNIHGEFARSA